MQLSNRPAAASRQAALPGADLQSAWQLFAALWTNHLAGLPDRATLADELDARTNALRQLAAHFLAGAR